MYYLQDEGELSKYTLADIDENFISAGEALEKFSSEKRCKCFTSLIKNWEVVIWITENCKGLWIMSVYLVTPCCTVCGLCL